MDLWTEAEQSGIQKGRKEGRDEELLRGRRNFAKAILSLSKAQNLPYAQYLQILKVPYSEREEFLALIGKMHKGDTLSS